MSQFVAYFIAHPGSIGISMAAGDNRWKVGATARRRKRALGIRTGRVAVKRRDDLGADAFADLCAAVARSFGDRAR